MWFILLLIFFIPLFYVLIPDIIEITKDLYYKKDSNDIDIIFNRIQPLWKKQLKNNYLSYYEEKVLLRELKKYKNIRGDMDYFTCGTGFRYY